MKLNTRMSRSRQGSRQNSPSKDTVLIYHDIRLRNEDVQSLQPKEWINDQIISFYFQYLESTIKQEFSQDILLVSAQVTQLLKMSEGRYEDAQNLLESLHHHAKQYFFFPVNNNEDDSEGGTHWSLLVFSRPENTFFVFDSIEKRNNYATMKLIEVLRNVLDCQSAHSCYYPSAQQKNYYDCGIFVICNVENIINHITEGINNFVNSVPPLSPNCVRGKRQKILEIIENLRARE